MVNQFGFDTNYFPLIIFPKKIEVILSSKPPIKRNYLLMLKGKKPEKTIVVSKWLFIISSPIFILFTLFGEMALSTLIILMTILVLLITIEVISNNKVHKKNLVDYEKRLKEIEINEANEELEMVIKWDEKYIKKYHKEFFDEYFKTVKKPNIRFRNRKGESEERFGYTLNYWFKERIFTNYAFQAPPGIIPYAPDFIYQDDNNLHIDIEIDEPFSKIDRIPIHFIDFTFDEYYADSQRDSYFADKKGWVIVRFAEEQVKTQRNECCKVIATIIYELTGDDSYLVKISNQFPLPNPIKRWTMQEATNMTKTYIKPKGYKYESFGLTLGSNFNDETHYKYSDWNNNIKLEECSNPYTDYDMIKSSDLFGS